jgi:hypothetical protein
MTSDNAFVRLFQTRAGLTADGIVGPATLAALDKAFPPSGGVSAPATGLVRIILHWTAGTHVVSETDRAHYHFIIGGDGAVYDGKHKPEANISTSDGAYAAHTRNCNTGSIGVAVAGMFGATEQPFNAGGFPIRQVQVDALVRLVADLCRKYRIPVTPRTVLSHAEVQPTLGIAQNGKWDISWLPGMTLPRDPVSVGNEIRSRIAAA